MRLSSRAWIAAVLLACGSAYAQSDSLTITLTGQSMIRSDLRATAPDAVPRIRSLLSGDVVFTNFEGAIAEPGQSVTGGGRGFLAPAEALDALGALGFNLLSLANNHAFDLKEVGIDNTLREVGRRGIAHAGIGATLAEAAAPAYLRIGNMTVALVASASGLIAPGGGARADGRGVNELRVMAGDAVNEANADLPDAPGNVPNAGDSARILQAIREAKAHADLVVVYQHNHVFGNHSFSTIFSEGMAERLEPNAWLKDWTHAEVDAGADVIVMHGAPLLHGVEIFGGKPIFYDLGNFIYNAPPAVWYISEPMSWESVVANLEFEGKTLRSITLHPIALNYVGNGQPDMHSQYTSNEFLHTRGLPSAAEGAQARYILERVAEFSKPFGTRVVIDRGAASIELGER
jgi:poly-gamma-glutamate capsule biosynthesis protein CapA/YwtB (metallophosphatase superfamily)